MVQSKEETTITDKLRALGIPQVSVDFLYSGESNASVIETELFRRYYETKPKLVWYR